ncbi:hypothetical protein GJ496_004354 [Pomphorhynchus laevis]|nr:hypothetical protein GJ496_004354 [Pomphorhynchus laevis]
MDNNPLIANQPIVIDNGSGIVKAGFAGNNVPKCVFSNIIGVQKHKRVMTGGLQGNLFVGPKVDEFRGLLRLRYPMEHGIVNHWDDMERIWNFIYSSDQLNAVPEEHPVLMTEAPLNPRKNREKAAEILFETFNSPALHFSLPSVLCLYSSGRTTGLVLDCGDGVCQAVPVYQGFAVNHSVMRGYMAGRDITKLLHLLLQKDGYLFKTSAEFEIVRAIKENICFVNPSLGKQSGDNFTDPSCEKKSYLLPDNTVIEVGNSRSHAPEILFRPDLIGCESQGVHGLVYSALISSDMDLRAALCSNIVLAGGSTLFKGFGDRLCTELQKLLAKDTKIKISAPKERIYSAWIGGSILASLEAFKRIWISKREYETEGLRALDRKLY